MRVLLFEELRGAPQRLVPELAAWCGADPGFYAAYDWPHRNESYAVRRRGVHRFVRRRVLPWVRGERVKRVLRPLYVRLVGDAAGAREPGREEREALSALRSRYAADNARLARSWKLDVGRWSGAP